MLTKLKGKKKIKHILSLALCLCCSLTPFLCFYNFFFYEFNESINDWLLFNDFDSETMSNKCVRKMITIKRMQAIESFMALMNIIVSLHSCRWCVTYDCDTI